VSAASSVAIAKLKGCARATNDPAYVRLAHPADVTICDKRMTVTAIVISSGHGKYVRGASGYVDEVDEARKVVEKVADLYRQMDVTVYVFHDDVSTSQSENLDRIVDFQKRIRSGDLTFGFTTRDIHQRDWAHLTEREHVAAGLELLVDYDYIAASARSVGPLGGRPAIRYEINPRGLK
jgi:hypothetical protein